MKWLVHSLCLSLGKRVLPPLAEQSRIVTRVAQLRRLCADLRQRLSASQSTQAHLAEALVQAVQQ
jgi:type I restriction enzyme S subunit